MDEMEEVGPDVWEKEWREGILDNVSSLVLYSTNDCKHDDDGSAQFDNPVGVTVDKLNNIYVADSGNHRIRKITPDGVVSTLAGVGETDFLLGSFRDGIGTREAQFNSPTDVAIDSLGNVYVADSFNDRIRKIAPDGWVSTFAGSMQGFKESAGTMAKFNHPISVSVDTEDNVYVVDEYNNRIRKITPDGWVSTFAGKGDYSCQHGISKKAGFKSLYSVVVDSADNVYVADSFNQRIYKITPDEVVNILAGNGRQGFKDGVSTEVQFRYPSGVTVDTENNVYVADTGNNRIRKITPDGMVSTLAGNKMGFEDGFGTEARFNHPRNVAVDASRNVYVADTRNYRIRKITSDGVVTTIAGCGTQGHKDSNF